MPVLFFLFDANREDANFIMRDFTVGSERTDELRRVVQCYFKGWPDYGVPESPGVFVDFLRLVDDCHDKSQDPGSPLLVHCSAGIGRTGTFCAAHTALEMFADSGEMDVANTVRQLRRCRARMVQNVGQYEFLHKALAHALLQQAEQGPPSPTKELRAARRVRWSDDDESALNTPLITRRPLSDLQESEESVRQEPATPPPLPAAPQASSEDRETTATPAPQPTSEAVHHTHISPPPPYTEKDPRLESSESLGESMAASKGGVSETNLTLASVAEEKSAEEERQGLEAEEEKDRTLESAAGENQDLQGRGEDTKDKEGPKVGEEEKEGPDERQEDLPDDGPAAERGSAGAEDVAEEAVASPVEAEQTPPAKDEVVGESPPAKDEVDAESPTAKEEVDGESPSTVVQQEEPSSEQADSTIVTPEAPEEAPEETRERPPAAMEAPPEEVMAPPIIPAEPVKAPSRQPPRKKTVIPGDEHISRGKRLNAGLLAMFENSGGASPATPKRTFKTGPPPVSKKPSVPTPSEKPPVSPPVKKPPVPIPVAVSKPLSAAPLASSARSDESSKSGVADSGKMSSNQAADNKDDKPKPGSLKSRWNFETPSDSKPRPSWQAQRQAKHEPGKPTPGQDDKPKPGSLKSRWKFEETASPSPQRPSWQATRRMKMEEDDAKRQAEQRKQKEERERAEKEAQEREERERRIKDHQEATRQGRAKKAMAMKDIEHILDIPEEEMKFEERKSKITLSAEATAPAGQKPKGGGPHRQESLQADITLTAAEQEALAAGAKASAVDQKALIDSLMDFGDLDVEVKKRKVVNTELTEEERKVLSSLGHEGGGEDLIDSLQNL